MKLLFDHILLFPFHYLSLPHEVQATSQNLIKHTALAVVGLRNQWHRCCRPSSMSTVSRLNLWKLYPKPKWRCLNDAVDGWMQDAWNFDWSSIDQRSPFFLPYCFCYRVSLHIWVVACLLVLRSSVWVALVSVSSNPFLISAVQCNTQVMPNEKVPLPLLITHDV